MNARGCETLAPSSIRKQWPPTKSRREDSKRKLHWNETRRITKWRALMKAIPMKEPISVVRSTSNKATRPEICWLLVQAEARMARFFKVIHWSPSLISLAIFVTDRVTVWREEKTALHLGTKPRRERSDWSSDLVLCWKKRNDINTILNREIWVLQTITVTGSPGNEMKKKLEEYTIPLEKKFDSPLLPDCRKKYGPLGYQERKSETWFTKVRNVVKFTVVRCFFKYFLGLFFSCVCGCVCGKNYLSSFASISQTRFIDGLILRQPR